MSVFKTSGIILKIHRTRDGKFLYTVFSEDFGKIICSKKYSKTEKSLDLGYIVNFEIITKTDSDISSIKNIKISSELITLAKSFSEINAYLELLAHISKNTVSGVQNREIFDILKALHSVQNRDNIYEKILLSKLKLISVLGDLGSQNKNPTVGRILKFIHGSKISDILKLSGLDDEVTRKLEKLV